MQQSADQAAHRYQKHSDNDPDGGASSTAGRRVTIGAKCSGNVGGGLW